MRFKPKKLRDKAPRASNVNFEFYSWDTELEGGWHPAVVLNAESKYTSKTEEKVTGGQLSEDTPHNMWTITFGLDLPEEIGGRIQWWVPDSFPPKQENMQEVLLAEYEGRDEEFELEPKALIFRKCAVLVYEDTEFEREDGKPSWKVKKILSLEKAIETLGTEDEPWPGERKGAASGGDEEEDALF